MTREEAKGYLMNISYQLGTTSVEYLSEKDGEKMREAIEALVQEPCEDAISRQAVLDILDDMVKDYVNENDFDKAQGIAWVKVQKLPPVSLKEPCEMTVEEYRQRMIQAFHNADCGELVALVVLPSEKEFEHLEWLLEKHYKAKPEQKRWIPVSERLPNLDDFTGTRRWQKEVLITGYLSFDDTKELFVSEAFAKDVIYNSVHDTVVTAWMPLPEPYKMCGGEK